MSSRKSRPLSAGRRSENGNNKRIQSQTRSPRHPDPPQNQQKNTGCKVESTKNGVKRSITVRKIAPRKTQVTVSPTLSLRRSPRISSEWNKENINRPTDGASDSLKKSTSALVLAPLSTVAASPPPSENAVLAPPLPNEAKPNEDPSSLEWSQKVRRSYSRLSCGDHSFQSPQSSPAAQRRETLFGFEQLETPSVAVQRAQRSRVCVDSSLSLLGASSSLFEGNSSSMSSPEPDLNIPGVAVVKEKRRRIKVQQIKMSELDLLAAKMNAEFEEAENFDLVVE
ncbi:sororin [Arapaima gigas]